MAQSAGAAEDKAAATESEEDAIVVTGYRKSLENAQRIKRNSDTIVTRSPQKILVRFQIVLLQKRCNAFRA